MTQKLGFDLILTPISTDDNDDDETTLGHSRDEGKSRIKYARSRSAGMEGCSSRARQPPLLARAVFLTLT